MKGLVCAALEKIRCIERENKDLRTADVLGRFELPSLNNDTLLSAFVGRSAMDEDAIKSSVGALVHELARVSCQNADLIKHNRVLREAGAQKFVTMYEEPTLKALYTDAISKSKMLAPTVSTLQAQITAMEYDWTQAKDMRDELFDYDAKLREHEMVAQEMGFKRVRPEDGARVFATSRRHMLEILVRDRNRNINGHFARRVIPLEQLRAEKDDEILALRKTLCQYELQFGIKSLELVLQDLTPNASKACELQAALISLDGQCASALSRLGLLQQTVQRYEDHAAEWKRAHEEALLVIAKSEKMRSEHDGMMASLRAEDERILAKKKGAPKGDVQGRFNRMRDISAEVDEVDGQIAVQELALCRLKKALAIKQQAFIKEKQGFDQLMLDIDRVAGQRKEYDAFVARTRTASDEELAAGLGAVCV
jgi:hypothetical protein